MKVYVVTCPDLGWDCVVGVYTDVSIEELKAEYEEDCYVITEKTVEKYLSCDDDESEV